MRERNISVEILPGFRTTFVITILLVTTLFMYFLNFYYNKSNIIQIRTKEAMLRLSFRNGLLSREEDLRPSDQQARHGRSSG